MKQKNQTSSIFKALLIFLICSGTMYAQENLLNTIIQNSLESEYEELSLNFKKDNPVFEEQIENQGLLFSKRKSRDNWRARPINLELGVWHGSTFSDSNNENGIRRVDIKYQLNDENLLYTFYDNALALENKFLASIERTAPMVGVGAKHDWSKKWFTKAEVGKRFLSTEEDQLLFNMENGYFFSSRLLGKLITQYDIRQNDNLLTMGAFLEYEVFKKVRLEGGFFHSENLTLSSTFNERFLLTPKFKFKTTEFIAGVYYDRLNTADLSLNQFGGVYGLFVFPIITDLQGKLFVNYDKGFFDNDITIVSIGTNFKF